MSISQYKHPIRFYALATIGPWTLWFAAGCMVVVFHITALYFNEILATHPDSTIIQTVLLPVLATLIALGRLGVLLRAVIPVKCQLHLIVRCPE